MKNFHNPLSVIARPQPRRSRLLPNKIASTDTRNDENVKILMVKVRSEINQTTRQPLNAQSGQVLILAMGLISLILLLTLFVLTLSHRTASNIQRSTQIIQARNLAEAGLNRALEQLARDSAWAGEVETTLGPGTFTIAVTDTNPPDPAHKLVRAVGAVPRLAPGATQVTLAMEVTGSGAGGQLSFNFAVQAGNGGIEMHNGARIRGNVWSNGPIIGLSSAQNQVITGGATAAGSTGLIDRVFVQGSILAHQINRAITSVNATADILTNTEFRTGKGYWEEQQSGNQGELIRTTVTLPEPQNLPLDDETVAEIRETFSSAPIHTGNYAIPGYVPQTLGPITITGNLDLATGANLTLTGNVRVLGNITLGNSASVQADPTQFSNGQETAIFMAEGNLVANQGARFVGSVVIVG